VAILTADHAALPFVDATGKWMCVAAVAEKRIAPHRSVDAAER
jgi:hypothetical protein